MITRWIDLFSMFAGRRTRGSFHHLLTTAHRCRRSEIDPYVIDEDPPPIRIWIHHRIPPYWLAPRSAEDPPTVKELRNLSKRIAPLLPNDPGRCRSSEKRSAPIFGTQYINHLRTTALPSTVVRRLKCRCSETNVLDRPPPPPPGIAEPPPLMSYFVE